MMALPSDTVVVDM